MSALIRTRTRLAVAGLVTRVYRTARGLWIPEYDAVVDARSNCLALLRSEITGVTHLIPGANIVTDAGDIHVAQRAAAETPTNAFTTWEMASAGTPGKAANRGGFTVIASSQLVQDAGYPKSNDNDADNTGAATDVRTSRASYSAASFTHAAITHAIITNATPGATEPIFAGWAWAASINKAATDTLKVFHNMTANGV